jgi:threonine dehydratase
MVRRRTLVTRARIAEIEPVIRPYIRRTPTIEIDGADIGLPGVPLTFKLELTQHAGSFKARGAFANLLLRNVPPAGVAAASGGNHGAAVAYAAMKLGLRARIFIPSISSQAKQDRIREYGAEMVIAGSAYADALAACEAHVATTGALGVHAFDQDETMLGAGTVGFELEHQAKGLSTFICQVGGGGLIAGVAAWYRNKIDVIGVEPESAPTLFRALEAGGPVDAEPTPGGAAGDSLAPRRVGEHVYPIAATFVRRVVLVPDEAIREAQQLLWRVLRVAAEPGGCAALAALISGRYVPLPGERVGVMVSGGNTVLPFG